MSDDTVTYALSARARIDRLDARMQSECQKLKEQIPRMECIVEQLGAGNISLKSEDLGLLLVLGQMGLFFVQHSTMSEELRQLMSQREEEGGMIDG